VEEAMSADLEREELAEVAREVACEKVGQCFTQGTDVMLIARAVKAAKYAYLAAATLREEEIEELRAEVNDWRESAKKAAGEPCGDEAHCACVPLLRAEIATLRARVAVLWGMVPRWVVADTGYPVKGTEFERLYSSGWRVVQMKDHCPYHSLTRLCLMAPPIPVPETKE
jgi:hypothetical protein